MTDHNTMSDQRLEAITVVEGVHFAENLRWRDGRLWFSDMYGDRIHAFDPATGRREVVGELFHPAGLGWLPDGRLLAVASEDKLVFVVTPDANELYADLSALMPGWANEMLVDAAGRAYVGNFGYDLFSEEMVPTRLVLVDPDARASIQPGDLAFPNGTVLRSDCTLVVAETFAARLAVFDVAVDGTLTPAGAIALPEGTTPDGICIDAEDGIWVTSPLSRSVLYLPGDGGAPLSYSVDDSPYACMLGGPDRRTLYVALAPDHEPDARRARAEGRIVAATVSVPGAGPDGLGEPT